MNLFEGVPYSIIRKTLKNIEENLSNVGIYGGHTISKHIGISEKTLVERVSNQNISAATTFKSQKLAEQAVVLTMKNGFNGVSEWLLSSSISDFSVQLSFAQTIGYGFKKNNSKRIESNRANVILVKDINADWGFRIKTAYPMI